MKLEIKQLTRIEGHANLVIDMTSGELCECRLEIVETPRFFESLLKGRHYSDVAPIVARICGICSNSHTLVSLMATEKALGIEVSSQTRSLRRLLAYGETLQSHLLQIFFMALPDYMGVPSIIQLAQSHRSLVTRVLRLKKLANDLCQLVGGRPVHPVTPCVGGFYSLPEASALQALRKRLVEGLPDMEHMVSLFSEFALPQFERPTEYLSLAGQHEYPLFSEEIFSSAGLSGTVGEYNSLIEEYLVPHSTAKFSRALQESYMVGPLARFKNATEYLSPMAAKVASALNLRADTVNPFAGLTARLVEVIHCLEEAIHLIDQLLLDGLHKESLPLVKEYGEGAAAIEAPRGTLFHHYNYDEKGLLMSANCIIPTAQNLANIEYDLKALVPQRLDLPRAELAQQLQMLIRSYDPCISCSTHALKIHYA